MADYKDAEHIALLLNYISCSTVAYKCTVICGSQNKQGVQTKGDLNFILTAVFSKLEAINQVTAMTVFCHTGCFWFKSNDKDSLDRMTQKVTCRKPWLPHIVISPTFSCV